MARKKTSGLDMKELQKENEQLTHTLKRLTADFENFQKRIDKEKHETKSAVNSDIILKLFPILDNFRRAAEHAPQIEVTDQGIPPLTEEEFHRIHAYFEGMRQIEQQMETVLSEVGLNRVETINQPFDHNTMEAISYETHPEIPKDVVIDEIEGGYVCNNKIMRPAKVRVSQGPS